MLHNIYFGADQHVWPLYCIIFCHRSVARGSTKSCVSALVTKTPILLTSKPKVDQALFMACLRCIRCCTTFSVVLINTPGHFVASYFATIVSQEVARGPACQQTLTLSNSLSLSTNLALIVKTPFIACLRCIRCCTTFISVLINTLGHYIALYFATIVSQEVALGLACQHLSLRHRFY